MGAFFRTKPYHLHLQYRGGRSDGVNGSTFIYRNTLFPIFFVILKVIKKGKVSEKIIRLTAQVWAVFFTIFVSEVAISTVIMKVLTGMFVLVTTSMTKLRAMRLLSKRLIY